VLSPKRKESGNSISCESGFVATNRSNEEQQHDEYHHQLTLYTYPATHVVGAIDEHWGDYILSVVQGNISDSRLGTLSSNQQCFCFHR
jgi:hypothetical protein